jgi:hypothetical protein
MHLSEIVREVEQSLGSEDPGQVLTVVLLLLQNEAFQADSSPKDHIRHAVLKLSSMTEQYGAVAKELDSLADTEPCEFDPQHIWTLIRAIKVQSKFVDLLTTTTPALS